MLIKFANGQLTEAFTALESVKYEQVGKTCGVFEQLTKNNKYVGDLGISRPYRMFMNSQ